ncbi:MAG: MFS transporter [Desulfobacterales bacterium]
MHGSKGRSGLHSSCSEGDRVHHQALHEECAVMTHANRRIFWVLCFSIFTAVTGVGIVVPLLPVYAKDLGASGFFIGMIFGIFSLSRTAAIPWFGALSDTRGRKPFIITGMLGYAVVSASFMAADTVVSLLVIRFFQGIASGMLMPVLQAYVGDITPEGRESTWMGTFNMAVFLGLSLGPLVGGWMNQHWNLTTAFAGMGIMSLAAFFLCLYFLPAVSAEPSRQSSPTGRNRWRRVLLNRQVAGLFAYRFAYTACIGIIWGFLPLYLDISFGFDSGLTGLVVTMGVFVSGIVQTPMGWVADWVRDKRWMVVIGGILAGTALWGFRWADHAAGFLLTSAAFGIGGGMAMPALMGLAVAEGVRVQAMGSLMSVLTMGHSMGMLAGALVAGVLMDGARLDLAFGAGAMAMAGGITLFLALCGSEGRRSKCLPAPPDPPGQTGLDPR